LVTTVPIVPVITPAPPATVTGYRPAVNVIAGAVALVMTVCTTRSCAVRPAGTG
jgi:hypothetical protein